MKTIILLGGSGLMLWLSGCAVAVDGSAAEEDLGDANVELLASSLRREVAPDLPSEPSPDIAPPTPGRTRKFVDLQPTGKAEMVAAAPSLGLWIEVINAGNMPTVSTYGYAVIDGVTHTVTVSSASTSVAVIGPGERGFLKASSLQPQECRSYQVQIDTTYLIQGESVGLPLAFENDSGVVRAPCPLTWVSCMTAAHLGVVPTANPQDVRTVSDGVREQIPVPLIAGRTLQDIVSSVGASARTDGRMCSHCHYNPYTPTTCEDCHPGSGRVRPARYKPKVNQNQSELIGPWDDVSGRTWAGPDGWAERFTKVKDDSTHDYVKPLYLREAFTKWLEDGARLN